MIKKLRILGLIMLLSCTFNIITYAQVVLPVKWEFSQKKISDNEAELIFTATIKEGWHMYSTDLPEGGPVKTTFTITPSKQFQLNGPINAQSEPEHQFDKNFNMDLSWFSKSVTFIQKVKLLSQQDTIAISGNVEFMSCDDQTCVPPSQEEFQFQITPETGSNTSSMWYFALLAFLSGLAALLTPCVFPMIPMTVSYFMHGNESKSKGKTKALIFGFSIIAIYTVVGTLVAVLIGPGAANFLSTHWLPNLLFFAIFVFFAFSFFGMFEIVLPSWMISKSDSQVDKGGYFGAFFMALTLVLVSFSCTGPIVGTILVQSAGGQILAPIIGMFSFSLAFALPFTFFALFPKFLENMPKSGGWLNSVKVVLGFIELALALKFLSIADQTYHQGILDREIYLAFWIVIFTLMGLYLLGKLKFAHDSDLPYISVPRLLLAICTFTFVIYLIPGMFGAPLKAISGYLPPTTTQDFDINKIVRDEARVVKKSIRNIEISGLSEKSALNTENALCEEPKYGDILELPLGIEGYFDYDQALACAKAKNKPLFLDFTGHGCVNCREMESAVWSDPRVLDLLENEFVVVALYVDDKQIDLPKEEWVKSTFDGKMKKTLGTKNADFQITRFNINAQPYYVILDHNEKELVKPEQYNLDPDNFVHFLESAIKKFKEQQ